MVDGVEAIEGEANVLDVLHRPPPAYVEAGPRVVDAFLEPGDVTPVAVVACRRLAVSAHDRRGRVQEYTRR